MTTVQPTGTTRKRTTRATTKATAQKREPAQRRQTARTRQTAAARQTTARTRQTTARTGQAASRTGQATSRTRQTATARTRQTTQRRQTTRQTAQRRRTAEERQSTSLPIPVVTPHVKIYNVPVPGTGAGMHKMAEAGRSAASYLPPRRRLAFYGALGAMAALEVISWPVAAVVGVGTAIAGRSRGMGKDRAKES
ncbi:hypothetical protein [Actinomadura rugatobispora]|uniref:Uncharacterized protein n=1 Tax=Actinomadura rugatobispora TaxID=1994 RepID=A0ABW1A4G8_9ACTN|nr:hypothetical protein GCM10010200_106840 [Actinomadura rugatobispora]